MSVLRLVLLCATLLTSGCGLLPESSRERARRDLLASLSPPRPRGAPDVSPVTSRASGPLVLDDVLESIERAHPTIAAALEEREAADGRLLAARGGFDLGIKGRAAWSPRGHYETFESSLGIEQPTPLWGAVVSAGYKLGDGDFAIWDGAKKTNRGGEVSVGARVPLLRDGPIDRTRAGIRQAEVDRDVASANVRRALIEMTRRGAREYWTWVAAGRRLAIAESLLALAESRAAAIEESTERGDLPAIERADNERLVAQRRALLAAARRAFEQSSYELGLYVRDAEGAPGLLDRSRVPASFPPVERVSPDRERLVADALQARPELHRYELLLERARVDLDLARNQQLPGLDGFVSASQDLRDEPYADKSPFELQVGVLLDVPLERRGAKGRERAASALLRSLSAEARLAGDRVATDVQDALSAIARSSERVAETERAARLAAQLADAERVAFEQGQSTILLVNLREQASADARALEVDALADYHRARADLRAALGLWQRGVE